MLPSPVSTASPLRTLSASVMPAPPTDGRVVHRDALEALVLAVLVEELADERLEVGADDRHEVLRWPRLDCINDLRVHA